MSNPNLITKEELHQKLGDVKIIDASWYLPAQNRNGRDEYEQARIPGAAYFDIDRISDQSSNLPHMLPTPSAFEEAASKLSISETDEIVVYDGPGLFSAARVWWTFKIMGAENVRILSGGFDRWKDDASLLVETDAPKAVAKASFKAEFDSSKVCNLRFLKENLKLGEHLVLDARPFDRFTGKAPEPRKGLRSGHIPGSKSLPASQLIKDGILRSDVELEEIFAGLKISKSMPLVTSCGSGVTAAIISLALTSVGHENNKLYDGSWSEWGANEDVPIAMWEG